MARVNGSSTTGVIVPSVKLVNYSTNPLGAIVSMWIGSRFDRGIDADIIEGLYNGTVYDAEAINRLTEYYPEYSGENHDDYRNVIINVANLVIKSNLPPLDAINFTFEISNVSVAFREQLVRGRLPQNFWTQTSRTADLKFMNINRLENIERFGGSKAVEIYDKACDTIRETYRLLEELGVPSEDIRLFPQGMTHRVYWIVPYRTLVSTIGKRMSWIAQSSLWLPIIAGIQSELYNHFPYLSNVIGVPSDVKIADGKIVSHKYDNENEDRYYGRDYQPCDPLWLVYKGLRAPEFTNRDMYYNMKKAYIQMWNEEVCNILGWDKKDPDKVGPYDPV